MNLMALLITITISISVLVIEFALAIKLNNLKSKLYELEKKIKEYEK